MEANSILSTYRQFPCYQLLSIVDQEELAKVVTRLNQRYDIGLEPSHELEFFPIQ